jgi:DNA invertase Pin-like site-specific DNA recombinase
MGRARTSKKLPANAVAVAYLRVSSQGQALEHRHGFDRQEAACRAWAKEHRRPLTAVYRDAHTGTEADRPEWERMILDIGQSATQGQQTEEIEGAKVEAAAPIQSTAVIVIESLDRLARDVIIQSVLIKRCIDAGVLLFAANTGENVCDAFLTDPTRKALLQIQGVFNQLEKDRLVIKLRKAREAKRQKAGRCEGRKRYGEHPVHTERENAVLNLVRQLRRKPIGGERLSVAAIAAELNTRAEQDSTLRPRTAAKWHPTQIRRLLA